MAMLAFVKSTCARILSACASNLSAAARADTLCSDEQTRMTCLAPNAALTCIARNLSAQSFRALSRLLITDKYQFD